LRSAAERQLAAQRQRRADGPIPGVSFLWRYLPVPEHKLRLFYASVSNPTSVLVSILCPSRAVRIVPSSRFGNGRTIAAVTHLHEQPFLAYAGEVATRNADFGQVFCPDFTLLKSEPDGAFPQCRLRATGKPDPLGAIAITLPNPDIGLWRSFEGNRQHVVRGFIQPGEPPPFVRRDAILRADLRFSPTLRSNSLLPEWQANSREGDRGQWQISVAPCPRLGRQRPHRIVDSAATSRKDMRPAVRERTLCLLHEADAQAGFPQCDRPGRLEANHSYAIQPSGGGSR
jgi:hypothetical protein